MFIMLHPPYEPAFYMYIVLLQNLVSFEGTPNRTNPKRLPRKSERPHTASVLFTHMYSSICNIRAYVHTLNVVLYDSYVSLPCICIFFFLFLYLTPMNFCRVRVAAYLTIKGYPTGFGPNGTSYIIYMKKCTLCIYYIYRVYKKMRVFFFR